MSNNANTNFDFSQVDPQRTFELVPENTICELQLKIHAGGAGDDGWRTRSKDGASENLACEFTVVGGDHDKKKFWQRQTMCGVTPKHDEAGRISMQLFRSMIDSAKGLRSDDKSEAADNVRKSFTGWADFNGLCFIARVGIGPAADGYPAKNKIQEVIAAEKQEWRQPTQIAKAANSGAPAPSSAPTPAPSAPPAGAIARPRWMQPE